VKHAGAQVIRTAMGGGLPRRCCRTPGDGGWQMVD